MNDVSVDGVSIDENVANSKQMVEISASKKSLDVLEVAGDARLLSGEFPLLDQDGRATSQFEKIFGYVRVFWAGNPDGKGYQTIGIVGDYGDLVLHRNFDGFEGALRWLAGSKNGSDIRHILSKADGGYEGRLRLDPRLAAKSMLEAIKYQCQSLIEDPCCAALFGDRAAEKMEFISALRTGTLERGRGNAKVDMASRIAYLEEADWSGVEHRLREIVPDMRSVDIGVSQSTLESIPEPFVVDSETLRIHALFRRLGSHLDDKMTLSISKNSIEAAVRDRFGRDAEMREASAEISTKIEEIVSKIADAIDVLDMEETLVDFVESTVEAVSENAARDVFLKTAYEIESRHGFDTVDGLKIGKCGVVDPGTIANLSALRHFAREQLGLNTNLKIVSNGHLERLSGYVADGPAVDGPAVDGPENASVGTSPRI